MYDHFFSYINKHVRCTLVLKFREKFKAKENGILLQRAEQQLPLLFCFLGVCHSALQKSKQNAETCFSFEKESIKLTFLIDFKLMAENYCTIRMQISLSVSHRKELVC